MSNSAFTPAVLTIPAAATTATGELNVISNPSAASLSTTGWTGVTAVGTNSPLNPTVTTAFSIANTAGAESSTSGGYASFTMPSGLQNKKLKVEFYFTTPATDVYKVSVYKGGSRVTLTTDASGSTTLTASTTGKFVAYFDTDTTANWTVNITRTSGSTGPIYVTNVIVGPGIQPQGAVVGEWTSYTPTITNITIGNGTITGQYRRVGTSIHTRVAVTFGSTSSISGVPTVSLPSGLTVDSSKISTNPISIIGNSFIKDATGSSFIGSVTYDSSGVAVYGADDAVNGVAYQSLANLFTWTTNDYFTSEFSLPIAEWASSGTVQLAQNDVEWAYNTTAWGTDNTSSNFGYGPGGASITGALSASLTQRVTFQTPVQVGDDLAVEISSDGKIFRRADTFMDASGNPVINSYSSLATGNSSAGVYLKSVSGSTTQLDVVFMRYASLANDDSPVVDWQNGWKWRVRKSSAGAAVGFGIVQPGVSSGLVSASGVPGNITGNAIAAGYVGEKITWTSAPSNQAATTSYADWTNASITLTAGVWLVQANINCIVTSGTTAGNDGELQIRITDSSNNVLQNLEKILRVKTPASAASTNAGCLTFSGIFNYATSSNVLKIRLRINDVSGTNSGTVYNNSSTTYSEFFAIRIA